MPESRCPEESELLPLACGEPPAAAIETHVAGCSNCQKALEHLKSEITMLRGFARSPAGSYFAEPIAPAATVGDMGVKDSPADHEELRRPRWHSFGGLGLLAFSLSVLLFLASILVLVIAEQEPLYTLGVLGLILAAGCLVLSIALAVGTKATIDDRADP